MKYEVFWEVIDSFLWHVLFPKKPCRRVHWRALQGHGLQHTATLSYSQTSDINRPWLNCKVMTLSYQLLNQDSGGHFVLCLTKFLDENKQYKNNQ